MTGTPPNARVLVSSDAFTAQTRGSSLTLQINGHTDYGTLTASGLVLNVLQPDGSLQPISYNAATPADYNDALTQLRTSVANADAAQAQAEASASAAAAVRVQAELSAGKQTCDAIKGSLAWVTGAPVCEQVPYLGTDGATYYSSVDLSASGALLGPMDTAGTGATQQECLNAYYPDLSTGPGRGPAGTWNDTLKACLP